MRYGRTVQQVWVPQFISPGRYDCLYSGMRELPHTYSCFVCGEANPLGLNLRFTTDGKIVQSRFVPRPEHIGFKYTIHGGLISTVLDELMVWACAVQTKRFAYCAELNVRFSQPLRPGEESIVSAELVNNRRDRIYETKGEIRGPSGQLIASATGKYMPIKDIEISDLARDFVGDPTAI
jgi:acyl-coenzyme A thioesterase PaaI-like protein